MREITHDREISGGLVVRSHLFRHLATFLGYRRL